MNRTCHYLFLTALHVAAALLAVQGSPALSDEDLPSSEAVDSKTLKHKVLTGYQGWFRCPGDAAGQGWRHWSRSGERIDPTTLTFEMWPDTSELGPDELFAATGFTHADGRQAYLFSSTHGQTVQRHFEWMQHYGLDGVFLQRFLVEVGHASLDLVLTHVRESAAKTGRVFAVCYDLSGMRRDKIVETLTADWKRLVDDRKITGDQNYLHHAGKPVVFVWGFYSDRFAGQLAHRVIDIFNDDDKYSATLVGGCQWHWRTEKDAQWAKAFRRFHVISPWNVGNASEHSGVKHAVTGYWKDDLAEAHRAGMEYLPVVYPGFGWTNLKGKRAAGATIPRLGGEFFWRQFVTARELDIEMAYVAMFDEVDEATAIFKVTNDPPTQANFATYDGLPSDWYLRLTAEGAKLIRREQPPGRAIPIRP